MLGIEDERTNILFSILDNIVDGIVIIDTQGVMRYCNKSIEHIFGYSKSEMINKTVNMLMAEPHASLHDLFIKRYLLTNEAHIIGIGRNVVAKRKSGELFPVSLAVSQNNIHDQIYFVGILHDLTESRNIEKERLELLSIVCHDIQNPLNNISLFLNKILGEIQETNSGLKEYTMLAQQSCLNILNLSENLLKIYESEFFKLNMQLVDIKKEFTSIINAAIQENLAKTEEKCVEILFEDQISQNAQCYIDVEKFHQLISSLLANAIKSSNDSSAITINAKLVDDRVCVGVFSACDPIPEAYRDKIFSKHFKDSYMRNGVEGLRLTICKNIVDKHGGKINFKIIKDGVEFYFMLPLITHLH